MLILLPPSEGKAAGGRGRPFRLSHPDEAAVVLPVLDYLRQRPLSAWPAFYGIKSADRAAEAQRANLDALDAPTEKAIRRYTGVVYDHIDFATLPDTTKAARRVLIASALFGLVDGSTGLPEYKLSMDGWLARYWKPINTGRLARRAKGKPVLNLLSQTYAKAVDYPHLITLDFRVSGGKKSAGHFGKAIKGRFVRWVLAENIADPSRFHEFTEDGYRFDGENFIQQG